MLASGYGSGHRYLKTKPIKQTTSSAWKIENLPIIHELGSSNWAQNHPFKSHTHVKNYQRVDSSAYIHDGAEAKGLKEREVGRFRETRPENATIYHGKIEGWDEEILTLHLVTTINITTTTITWMMRDVFVRDTELDLPTHLSLLVPLLVMMMMKVLVLSLSLEFCYLHIKVGNWETRWCFVFVVLFCFVVGSRREKKGTKGVCCW